MKMRITHVAVWTADLERLRSFYQHYFAATSGERYTNPAKGFSSYFLSFGDGARLELMSIPGLSAKAPGDLVGLAHFALSVGSEAAVIELTDALKRDGVAVLSLPRRTGDGYFESVIADPDGNHVEIVV